MRFRTEFIGAIRRGEKTEHRRPYTGREPRYYGGQYRIIERTFDERIEVDGAVRYEARRQTLEGEYIQIQHVERQRVEELSPRQALAEGFASVALFIEFWDALYGSQVGPVWCLSFRYTTDVPNFLARQHGLLDPPQYVQSQQRAIDDLEAPPTEEIAAINTRLRNRTARQHRKDAQALLAACPTPEARSAALHELARAHNIDFRSDARALERRVLDRIGKTS